MRYGTEVRARMFVQNPHDQRVNALLGLAGEAGEIADCYKKTWFHPPHPKRSPAELRAEMGDLLWYLAALAEIEFGCSLLDLAKENIQKLRGRWPEKYDSVDIEALTL